MPEVIVEGLPPFEDAGRELDARFAVAQEFATDVARAETDEPWFQQTVLGLLTDTLFAYQQLKLGLERSESLLAWAARNLLELAIWTEYVTTSFEQAERFYQDWVIDGSELFQSLEDWHVAVGGAPDKVTLAFIESMKQSKLECGLSQRESFLRASDVAAGELKEEFGNMNRVYSKFVHPTAWSILKMQQHFDLKNMKRILFVKGATYGLQISSALYRHYERYGLAPPPKTST